MNTLTKGFAKRVLSMLLVTIMVFSLGIVGLTSASAANVELADISYSVDSGATIYFDNTYSKISTTYNISLMVGKSDWSRAYKMTKLTDRLYYVSNVSWSDATQIAIIGTNSEWDAAGSDTSNGENNSIGNRKGYAQWSSNVFNMTKNISGLALLTADSSTGKTLSVTEQSNYTNLNHDQTAYVYSANYGSTTYSLNAAGGNVTANGSYLSAKTTVSPRSQMSTGSNATFTQSYARGSNVTFVATPSEGYTFMGWYSSSTETSTRIESSDTLVCNAQDHGKYYALFKASTPPVSFTDVTISAPEEAVIGNDSVIQLGYTVTGSSSTPTYQLLQNGAVYNGDYTVDVANKKITVASPEIPGRYNFSVKITVDGVSYTTDVAPIDYIAVYSASLSADKKSGYTDDTFTFTIKDNSEQYGGATYEVYCNGEVVNTPVTDKTFKVSDLTAGDYTYKVVATVPGEEPVTTNEVTITVKAKIFSVYLTAPKSNMEDHEFTVTATHEFATEGKEVTYTLKYNDGEKDCEISNTNGQFRISIREVGNYTLTVTASDGVQEPVTDTATIEITFDAGSYPVRILFKCSDTYGYLPNMSVKINGNEAQTIQRQKYTVIESRPNATDTATYSWYYYEIPDVDFGTDIVFEVNANRSYFYSASYTISAAEGDFVDDNGTYCYYLALENLNGGTNILTNISALNEAERNWTESAVNMIYDDADALAPVALNFSYADMGDANTDGNVNIKDATYIQKSLANIVEASELSTIVSDVNGDGKVTIKDATAVQKQLAGL